jgi:hypothetical protein
MLVNRDSHFESTNYSTMLNLILQEHSKSPDFPKVDMVFGFRHSGAREFGPRSVRGESMIALIISGWVGSLQWLDPAKVARCFRMP